MVENIEQNKVVLQNISKILNDVGVVDYNPEITSTLLDIFHCIINHIILDCASRYVKELSTLDEKFPGIQPHAHKLSIGDVKYVHEQILKNMSPATIQSLVEEGEVKNRIPLPPCPLENKVLLPQSQIDYEMHPIPPIIPVMVDPPINSNEVPSSPISTYSASIFYFFL